MPPIGPLKRKDLIYHLGRLGYEGPTPRGKHQIMRKGNSTLIIPNPHKGDISVDLLKRILKQAGIERNEWEAL